MSKIIFTAEEFVQKIKDIQSNYKTAYAWGSFGFPLTERNVDRVVKQYNNLYTQTDRTRLKSLIGKGYFMFDCVGLIKGVFWGFSGNAKNDNGGCKYCSNGVADMDCNQMKDTCRQQITGNFDDVLPGEFLWRHGHIGIAIGNGLAIECTPSWAGGVQITRIKGGGSKETTYPERSWTLHGKSVYLDFSNQKTDDKGQNGSQNSQTTRKVGKIFLSAGIAAKRTSPSTSGIMMGRCDRGALYPISDSIVDRSGVEWLHHAGKELYSSRTDTVSRDELFKMHGSYSEIKTTANCRIRNAPGTNSAIIATVLPNKTVYWTGKTIARNGYVWAEVVYEGKLCYCDEQWLDTK